MWEIPKDEAEAFELVDGHKPWLVGQVHPSRTIAALEFKAPEAKNEQGAAVWELSTGRAIWAPRDAAKISWIHDGSEAVVITNVKPYQTGSLERYSWPDRELLGRAFIRLGGYMFTNLRVSPTSGVVAVAAIDQGETAISLYALPEKAVGTRRLGQTVRPSNLIDELEFSPDGSALVWTISEGGLWWRPDQQTDEYLPSAGGKYRAGEICVWETPGGEPQNLRVIEVLANLTPGWLPQEAEDLVSEMIHGPVFLDGRRFRILLPTGEWKTYNLDGNALEDREAGRLAKIKDVTLRSLRTIAVG